MTLPPRSKRAANGGATDLPSFWPAGATFWPMEATENGEMAPMCGPTPAPTMNRIDCFIVDRSSFEEFRKRTSALSNNKKGKLQERLTQVYLQTEPEYQTALKRVWLLSET